MTHPAHVFELCLGILCFIGIWFSISNNNSVKRALIGRPMRTAELHAQHNKLSLLSPVFLISRYPL